MAEDVLALVRNQASFQNIAIQTELDPELPAVLADRGSDAPGRPEHHPECGRCHAPGRRASHPVAIRIQIQTTWSLRISDTGPGIPAEIQDKLFEPFFTTKKTGTGLGLAIAYGIMERHKGELKVESSPGHGTTVTMVLPTDVRTIDE